MWAKYLSNERDRVHDLDLSRTRVRDYCVKHLAWGIPGPEAIEELNKYTKLIEIGAGDSMFVLIKS